MTYKEAKVLVDADIRRMLRKWNKVFSNDDWKTNPKMSVLVEGQPHQLIKKTPTQERLDKAWGMYLKKNLEKKYGKMQKTPQVQSDVPPQNGVR